jgi:hypothetical protein
MVIIQLMLSVCFYICPIKEQMQLLNINSHAIKKSISMTTTNGDSSFYRATSSPTTFRNCCQYRKYNEITFIISGLIYHLKHLHTI